MRRTHFHTFPPIYSSAIQAGRPDPEGWVRESTGGLLYWVPHDCRAGLHSPALLTIPLTSPVRSVSLQFESLPLEPLGPKFSTLHSPRSFYILDFVLVSLCYSLVVVVASLLLLFSLCQGHLAGLPYLSDIRIRFSA
jgi:hypothetical protein